MQKGWLKCEVSDGQLPNEYAVQCSSFDGVKFSFFAGPEFIDVKRGLVKVDVMDCRNDLCLVYVPFEPLEGVSRTIKVDYSKILKSNSK